MLHPTTITCTPPPNPWIALCSWKNVPPEADDPKSPAPLVIADGTAVAMKQMFNGEHTRITEEHEMAPARAHGVGMAGLTCRVAGLQRCGRPSARWGPFA